MRTSLEKSDLGRSILTEIAEISVDQLAKLDLQSICLVDVREEYEYIEMRVPGAELLPLAEVPEQVEKFPKNKPVYLICASGNRSKVAGEYLAKFHIDTINIAGGTKEWVSSGRAYNSGDADLALF